ncbi:MAG TPA: hydrogenase maturation protease [Vulgatibacter sp.]
MTRARVIGLGQSAAGDDGVGVAVVRALRERGLPSGVEVHHLSDPSALAALLDPNVPVVIVDAVLGSSPGELVALTPDELATHAPLRVSSHGLGITEAIGLARVLDAGADLPVVRIVAVTITRPAGYREGLSAEVAAAVPRAADRVLQLLEVDHP